MVGALAHLAAGVLRALPFHEGKRRTHYTRGRTDAGLSQATSSIPLEMNV